MNNVEAILQKLQDRLKLELTGFIGEEVDVVIRLAKADTPDSKISLNSVSKVGENKHE